MKRLKGYVLVGLCLLMVAGSLFGAHAAVRKITVVMNYTIEGDHSPWFVALDKGYFAKEGLDVDIQRGYGSGDTVQKVATGVADIGFADMVPLVMAIADGAQVKAIMGGNVKEPSALYSAKEDANITGPKEMEGKTIGGPPADVSIILLKAVMDKVGADYGKVKIINMDASTRLPMLATGKIDSAASFYEKEIMFKKALAQTGKTLVSWRYDKYLDKYSCVAITSQKLIKENPKVLRSFVYALLKGYKDALEDPDRGAASVMKLHPEFDKEYIYASAKTLDDLVWDETTKTKGLGMLSSNKVQNTVDIASKYWTIKRQVKSSEVFTNDFITWANKRAK